MVKVNESKEKEMKTRTSSGGHFGAMTMSKVEKAFAEINPDWTIDNGPIAPDPKNAKWSIWGYIVTDAFTGNTFTGKTPRAALQAAGAHWAISRAAGL